MKTVLYTFIISLFGLIPYCSLAVECIDYPISDRMLFILDSGMNNKANRTESFFKQIYCDLTFWNWRSINFTLTHGSSAASYERIDIDSWVDKEERENDPKNSFTTDISTSIGLGIGRVYADSVCLVSFCGISFDFLDFTNDKGFQLREYDPNTETFQPTEKIEFQTFGVGADICIYKIFSYKPSIIRPGTPPGLEEITACYTPSYGQIKIDIINQNGTRDNITKNTNYEKSSASLGLGWEGYGIFTLGWVEYKFKNILPEDCSIGECPKNIHISSAQISYAFQF